LITLQTHLPGYVSNSDSLKAKGINEIVCISVNDPFVMDAWGVAQNAKGKVKSFLLNYIFMDRESTAHLHLYLEFWDDVIYTISTILKIN
jgi:hypothetical protein